MNEYIKYVIVCVIILIFDAIWIGSNINMYSESVKEVQKSEMIVNKWSALLAYILVLFTSMYIAIPFTKLHIDKNKDSILDKLWKAFIYGGAVGFAVYGIYNTTCLSIYQNYSWLVALKDTIWGTFLNTITVFIYLLL